MSKKVCVWVLTVPTQRYIEVRTAGNKKEGKISSYSNIPFISNILWGRESDIVILIKWNKNEISVTVLHDSKSGVLACSMHEVGAGLVKSLNHVKKEA